MPTTTVSVSLQSSYERFSASGNPAGSGTPTRTQTIYREYRGNRVTVPPVVNNGVLFRNMSSWRHGSMTYAESPGNFTITTSSGAREIWKGAYPFSSLSYTPDVIVGGTWSPGAAWNSNNDKQAQVECMLRLRDTKVDLGTALGESRETLAFIAKNLHRLLSAYRAARRGNFRGVAKHLGVKFRKGARDPGKGWLEYQYGWLPMMGDIYGATQQLQDGFRKKDQIVCARRTITDELSVSTQWLKGKAVRKQRCIIYAKVNSAQLLAYSQLGLVNPFAVAWELVPFSFVVDWALPIGNVLSAATANFGLTFMTGARSCRLSGRYERLGSYEGPQFYSGKGSGSRAKGVTTFESYERVKMGGFPLPQLYYKNPFSMSHITSALALLAQVRR